MEIFNFWSLYVITVFVASIIPGPSMLLALTHGLKYGTKVSVFTALGNTLASMIQASISVAGLGVILMTSTTLFMIIKYLGALYLMYLGIKLFKTPFAIENQKNSLEKEPPNRYKIFTEAFIVASSNPKALIFFTALFPHFIHEGQNNLLHYSLLVVVLGVIAFVCMMIYSLSAHMIRDMFHKTSLSKYFGKVIGMLFISLGTGLAFAKNKDF